MFYFIFYYIVLIIIVALFCYAGYEENKRHAIEATKLKNDFEEWLFSNGETPRPSNALFVELYKACYREDSYPLKVYSGNRTIVKMDTVDVVTGFPSLHKQLIPTQMTLLENLESHFNLQFERSTTIGYYLRLIVSIPERILRYLGLDDQQTTGKVLKALIWILSLFLPPLKELVLSFIDFLLHRQ